MKQFIIILLLILSRGGYCKMDSTQLETAINDCSGIKYDEPEIVKGKLLKFLKLSEVEKSPYFKSKCYSILGEIYRVTAKPDSAQIYLENALEIRMEFGYSLHAASSHEYLSRLLLSLGEDSLGLVHLYKSLTIKKQDGNPNYLKGLYSGLGNVHFNLENYDSALFYHTQALQIYIDQNDTEGVATAYTNLGNIEYNNDRLERAIFYYRLSRAKYLELGAFGRTISPVIDLGVCKYELGQYDSALYLFQEAERIVEQTGNFENLDYIILSKAEVYVKLNYSDSAVSMFDEYISYRDSVYSIEKQVAIIDATAEYEAKYQTQEAQQKGQFERTEKEKFQAEDANKRLTIYLLLSAFGIIAIALFFWRRNTKQKSKLNSLEVDVKNQEINTLLKTQEAKSYAALLEGQNAERERIAQDLHDQLGGTLAAVKVHFGLMDQKIDEIKSENRDLFDKVNGMLSEAVQDVRRISHDLASGRISKLGLKGALEDLATILNTAKKMEVDFFMDDSLPEFDKKKEQEIYTIIQEIISNTLKHANAQTVELQLNRNDKMLNILYEDNGIGFVLDNARLNGLGLTGINNRVEKLGGTVNYDSVIGRGTIIIINIPL
ncbi:MAG: tetratricopeptide repeat protein [Crocinitomix sp.]|nr:tetratricopeptide repeat protein [Crocinitomix sp.]